MSCYGHTVPPAAQKYQGDGQSVKQILAQCPDPATPHSIPAFCVYLIYNFIYFCFFFSNHYTNLKIWLSSIIPHIPPLPLLFTGRHHHTSHHGS